MRRARPLVPASEQFMRLWRRASQSGTARPNGLAYAGLDRLTRDRGYCDLYEHLRAT